MAKIPEKMSELAELFDLLDRSTKIETLISTAERYRGVPEEIATRPYPEQNRVQGCESEAYVWSRPLGDGTLRFHIAVENPQGVSAMATAVILDECCSGAPLAEVTALPRDIVYRFFGRELSMGKSMGLMGMIDAVKAHAAKALQGLATPPRD